MDLSLSGRRAVVTGGSKGIGFAVARELVAEGAAVAICARNPDEVQAAAGELIARGGTVHASVTDITKPDQVEAFIAAAAETLGGIDILVNNAGAAHPGTFETLTDAAWQGDLDVKLFSQIRCTRAALPHLRASNAARVININAIYARYPDPAFFATTVNRAALRRGVFHSVPDLITKIEDYLTAHNDNPQALPLDRNRRRHLTKVARGRVALQAVNQ